MTAHDPDSPSEHQSAPSERPTLVDAIFEDGMIKPLAPLNLPPGTPLQLRIRRQVTVVATAVATPAEDRTVPAQRRVLPQVRMLFGRLDLLLFVLGLLVYAITRFVALDRFPIYFFSDEAIQTTLASDLLRDHFRDGTGTLLPPYFLNTYYWNLSLSVYAQVIGVALFGKSILVTRGTSALVSILSAVAISLTLKLAFKQRCWWLGALVVASFPAWFLHSRTAFETALSVSFYACFLCAYLLYRYRSPNYLYLTLVMGAATFYSYANGQGVMLVTGVLLLLSDLRYHWSQRRNLRLVGGAMLLLLLLIVPYIRFRYLHPDAIDAQLRQLSSYWFEPLPLGTKLTTFGSNYLWGLSPGYWFLPNDTDISRHRMDDLGNISVIFLPFALLGVWICLRQWRSPAHRSVLLAMLAVPFSPSLVAIGITRVLFMIVPAALLICLGIDQVYRWTQRYVPYLAFALGCCAFLSVMDLALLRSALVNGPTWSTDYTLNGMQYGAEQLFAIIPTRLAQQPDTQILLTPTWANGADVFAQFFLTPEQQERVIIENVDAFTNYRQPLTDQQLFIMTTDEYEHARVNPKLVIQPPEQVLLYPDGSPGFYFVRMRYSAPDDTLFAQEKLERQRPVVEQAMIDGQPVEVSHSLFDAGQVSDIFDHNTNTLARGMEANPLVIELRFPNPRAITTVSLVTASVHFQLKIIATSASGDPPRSFTHEYSSPTPDPRVDADLPDGTQPVSTLRIEITDLDAAPNDPTHIHVRELSPH